MQKDEAVELRTTGKLQSQCANIKKEPGKMMNLRLIDSAGTIYIYDPQVGKIEQLKMGVVAASGSVTLTEYFKGQIGDGAIKVTAKDDVLSFSFGVGSNEMTVDYFRSSEHEARRYYAAEEACR